MDKKHQNVSIKLDELRITRNQPSFSVVNSYRLPRMIL